MKEKILRQIKSHLQYMSIAEKKIANTILEDPHTVIASSLGHGVVGNRLPRLFKLHGRGSRQPDLCQRGNLAGLGQADPRVACADGGGRGPCPALSQVEKEPHGRM